jgi:hypothetical protein
MSLKASWEMTAMFLGKSFQAPIEDFSIHVGGQRRYHLQRAGHGPIRV